MRAHLGKLLLFGAFVLACVTIMVVEYFRYQGSFMQLTPYERPYTGSTEEVLSSESIPPTAAPTEPPTEAVVFPLNLNTATMEELCEIPGIGTVTASAIAAYRTEIGGFTNRRQLLEVTGIGEGTLEAILPYLYLPDEAVPETMPETEAPTSPPAPTEPPEVPTTEAVIPIIDLNTATREELLLLPDCTEALADRILEVRDSIHGFQSREELYLVEDMTQRLYSLWLPYLTLSERTGS